MCLPSAAGPVLQLPGQKAGPCGVSVLSTWGMQGPAPSQAQHIFHTWRGCTGPLICDCMERWLRTRMLHLCMPAVSAQTHTFHLPVGEVAVCWGLPGIRHVVRAEVGSGGWSLFQIFLFLLVPLFFLVQNFLMEKRSMLRSILKGSSSTQICALCAAYRMGLISGYINSPVPEGTVGQYRDPTAILNILVWVLGAVWLQWYWAWLIKISCVCFVVWSLVLFWIRLFITNLLIGIQCPFCNGIWILNRSLRCCYCDNNADNDNNQKWRTTSAKYLLLAFRWINTLTFKVKAYLSTEGIFNIYLEF